jgi:hypothetical protein
MKAGATRTGIPMTPCVSALLSAFLSLILGGCGAWTPREFAPDAVVERESPSTHLC